MPEAAFPGSLPVHEVRCQVLGTEPLNHDVTRVWLRLPATPLIQWYAGQYLELLMPEGPCPFSIATAPEESLRDLELHIRYGPDNPSSLEILSTLESSETVGVRLPGGARYIREQPNRPVWFICGSTGFAPAKAMIEHLRNTGFRQAIRLFWGARSPADLYLDSLAREWVAELPDFVYTPILSEQAPSGYRSGVAHEAAIEHLEGGPAPLVHVAGSPTMAWATFDALVDAGLSEDSIHSDVFDYAPR